MASACVIAILTTPAPLLDRQQQIVPRASPAFLASPSPVLTLDSYRETLQWPSSLRAVPPKLFSSLLSKIQSKSSKSISSILSSLANNGQKGLLTPGSPHS
jgi:hypothetical protein